MVNVAEILKQVPVGTKLWSNIYGEVFFDSIDYTEEYPIICLDAFQNQKFFTKHGYYDKMYEEYGECTLWPSKDHRVWDNEALRILGIEKKPEIPFNLQPFDKVLVRDLSEDYWHADFFSFIYSGEETSFLFICIGNQWNYCIPYNGETKHLLGTNQEPPEKYRI